MNDIEEKAKAAEKRLRKRLKKRGVTDRGEQYYIIANCYYEGTEGLTRNEEKSIQFYERAASRGNVDALFGLAVCNENGIGVAKKNRSEAYTFTLYEQAAEKGNLDAIFKVACAYAEGLVVEKNEKKAVELFQQAAVNGHLNAMFNLALFYSTGRGTGKKSVKAFELFKKASDRGHLNAKKILASTYAKGMGDEKDRVKSSNKAHELFMEYSVQDDLDSRFIVAVSYLHAIDQERDEKLAVKNFEKCANHGHLRSIYALGWCHQHGIGLPQNTTEATNLFKMGFLQGHVLSLFAYALLSALSVDLPVTDSGKIAIDNFLLEVGCAFNITHEWVDWECPHIMNHVNDLRRKYALRDQTSQYLDENDACAVIHLLAQVLASTFEPSNVRVAQELVTCFASTEKAQCIPSTWARIFVSDLYERKEILWPQVQLPREIIFASYDDIIPLGLIGHGQFSKVYLAWQPVADRLVAVKCFDDRLAAKDELLAKNALREQMTCRVLRAKDVKGTAKYFGYTEFPESGMRGLVFELCADISAIKRLVKRMKKESRSPKKLDELLDWESRVRSSLRTSVVFSESRRWTLSKIVGMLREAAEALSEIHDNGFIHRDVAPRNILCDANGAIRLADFGLAKFLGSNEGSNEDDSQILADYRKRHFSPEHQYAFAWWAPECFGSAEHHRDGLFSCASDIYSFGITMWQCFSHMDPYSHVFTERGNEDIAARTVEKVIVEGERPNLLLVGNGGVLDADTPRDLIRLIKSCWKKKPQERPTLKHIIEELRHIESATSTNSQRQGRISFKSACTHWFDIAAIYKFRSLPNRGSYPSLHLEGLSARVQPYDVFLVNAGEQKLLAVDTMKRILEEGNPSMRCFLDRVMSQGVSPTETMRWALRTSRYAVVILSKQFFSKRHPSEELMYVFRRMKWIRQHGFRWESLRVILYNITDKDYERQEPSSKFPLPQTLCRNVVVREWNERGETTWWDVCLELKASLIEEDTKCGAIAKWLSYLKQTSGATPPLGFPSDDNLYV